MSLLETFGEIFRPEKTRQELKNKVYRDWVIFKHLDPTDDLFTAYDDLIDAQLDILKHEHNCIPDWVPEYEKHSKIYYAPMQVKSKDLVNFQNYEFSKN